MGTVKPLVPVKAFTAVLVSGKQPFGEVEAELTALAGPVDHRTERIPFQFTDYYAPEMGADLERVLVSFEQLIEPDALAGLKLRTNAIENGMRGDASSGRRVNIDPGYLEQSKVVLASTKNFYHRVYLSQGIFAEVTMHFRNNTYQFFPWTYPDYKTKPYQQFFLRMRQIYRSQLKRICVNRKTDPE